MRHFPPVLLAAGGVLWWHTFETVIVPRFGLTGRDGVTAIKPDVMWTKL